jgi:signal transduction histidine kinase
VLILTPRTGDIPVFIASVGRSVFIASLIIALLAALLAILFGRTITRPLANLATAARVMQSGDYSARVTTNAPGELGELAQTFNEMAAQLHRDVEELRQQELWRRELIMNITHDLATPLTAIAGLGESLVDGVNQSREDYEATGQIIVRETLRLRRLVKDLHVMAKVEAGALSPASKPVRLAALVDEVLAVLAPEFERVQVEPNNVIPYNLPVVQADPDMLTRVFSNLCDNALRHTPADGCVTIAAEQHGQELVISVTDTGEGIPPEALPRIFERFFRADSSRQSATGGSGLGLAIVQAIVEAHHGKIWAENIPDGGASIKFTLPLPVDSIQVLSEATTQPALQKQLPRSGKSPTVTDNAVLK